jgi:hypothetical protein
MNLGDFKNFSAAKLGLTDTLTKTQAGEFAKARWRMIWNFHLWRQTRHADEVAVASGQQVVILPASFETPLAARWNATQGLAATLDLSVFGADPANWNVPGPVLRYSPMPRAEDGRVQIRLHGTPEKAGVLLVLGKRTCIDLIADTDTPLISGTDECLIAFIMGDLYQWMRQFSKAQIFFQEANALLAKMVEIETAQTTETRQIIPYTQQLEDCGGGYGWSK